MKNQPILKIVANRCGVYEVGIRTSAVEYQQADRLSTAIRPAINMIETAIHEV